MRNTIKAILYVLAAAFGIIFGIAFDVQRYIIAIIVIAMVFLMWIIVTLSTAIHKSANKLNNENKAKNAEKFTQAREKEEKSNAEYERICHRVSQILKNANKPERCNTVKFVEKPYLFPNMVSYQYWADWDIWVNEGMLCLYQKEVEMYPEGSDLDAPEICIIAIHNIQYFKLEGTVESATYVTGGKVTQDKKTGKVSQTALKNTTKTKDSRFVKVSVVADGIVETLEFNKESYDIFLMLIPEKEYNRIITG